MNNTYQLSQSGIERLERFKRDIEAGDFEIRESGYYSDGSVMYYEVENKDSVTCCFDCDYSDVVEIALEQIENALTSGVERKIMRHDKSVYYCSKSSGIGLMLTDITTPAQRALEALGKKLQDRSAVWN